MATLHLKMDLEGDPQDLARAVKWLNRGGLTALDNAIRIESKKLVVMLKKMIRVGGKPKFPPISSFSHAVRRAYGFSGRKPGKRSGQLIKTIKRHRVGSKSKMTWFAGVKDPSIYRERSGKQFRLHNAFHLASVLEVGRRGYVIELDKVSKRTGKTARQWMTWLFLQGKIKTRLKKSTKYIRIKPAPPRKFVEPVWKDERVKSALRIQHHYVSAFFKKHPTVRRV